MHHDLGVVEPQGGNIPFVICCSYLSDLLGLVAERQVTIQIFPSNPLPVACPFTKQLALHPIMQTEAKAFGNNTRTSQQIRNA